MPTILPPPDLLPVFNAQPGATLLLSPELVIVGASDDYLAATLTERATIVGQFIFDAFPDNPEAPEANAVANVRASLAQVMATRQPHEMAPQPYDAPDPAQPGRFVKRHWLLRHTPVLDAAGQVQFLIQSVQDITARRQAERQLRESQAGEQLARADAERQRRELRYFLEQSPVAVYRGPEYRVELANAATLAIWDRPLEAVLGRPVFEVLPEAATPGCGPSLSACSPPAPPTRPTSSPPASTATAGRRSYTGTSYLALVKSLVQKSHLGLLSL